MTAAARTSLTISLLALAKPTRARIRDPLNSDVRNQPMAPSLREAKLGLKNGRRVIAIALFVAACGGSADQSTDPTVGETTSTSVPAASTSAAAPTTSTTVSELTIPEADGLSPDSYDPAGNPLAAGIYTTMTAGVPITFNMPEGWAMENIAQLGAAWVPAELPETGYIAIVRFEGEVFDDPCGKEPPTEIEANAQSMIDWLSTNPNLAASTVESVTIGGQEGHRFLATSLVPPECTDPPWLFLVGLPVVGDYHLTADTTAEFTAVDVDGSVLLIVSESATEDWEQMKSISDGFLGNVMLGG